MKKIFVFLVSSLVGLAAFAQTVTIEVRGDRNRSILVDGQTYPVTSSVSGTNNPIVLANLSTGQHTVQVMRTNRDNDVYVPGLVTTFNLRSGYNMEVTVLANGSIQLSETRSSNVGTGNVMSDAEFARLLQRVRNERNQARRITAIRNSFDNVTYFTTDQVYDLVSTINSQAQRLALAKLGYKNVVDGENYERMENLLSGRARKNDLAAFVKDFNMDHPGHIGNLHLAMSTEDFDRLYEEAQGHWSASSRMTFISTRVFGPSANYFTVEQTRRMITLMGTESDKLQLAKEAYDNLVRPSDYTELNNLFVYQSSRNELANYVNNRDLDNPRQPMTATRFNDLYVDIRQQWSYSERYSQIEDAFQNNNNYFTSTQATQLISLVSAESDRLRLAKMSWDRVTDPSNYAQYYDILQSTASRNEFNAHINASAAYAPEVTAMSSAAFNSLYNKIRFQWGLGVKMSSLTDVFNDPVNYFTVAQAKQLITLVSAEYNRLTLAKLAYDNVVDKENFDQLNDIFDSQASVNELNTFVNSYSYNR